MDDTINIERNLCAPYNSSEFTVVTGLRAGSGTLSLVLSLLSTAVIVVFRKYTVFLQRLVLYYCIAAALSGLFAAFHRVDYWGVNTATEQYCKFSGFFQQYSDWIVLLSIFFLTTGVIFNAAESRRRAVVRSRRHTSTLLPLMIFVIPLLFNWVPFMFAAYGRAGPYCWIRGQEEDCSPFRTGVVLQIALWYAPVALFVILLFLAYIAICATVVVQSLRPTGGEVVEAERNRSFERQRRTEVLRIVVYPVIFLVANAPSAINYTYAFVRPSFLPLYPVWIMNAILSPLSLGVVSVMLTVDRQTLGKMRPRELRKAMCAFIGGLITDRVNSYHVAPLSNDSDDTRLLA